MIIKENKEMYDTVIKIIKSDTYCR